MTGCSKVDLVADLLVALQGEHVLEATTFRHFNQRIGLTGVFVGDIFDEQQNQHIVLVLRGVHAAAQFVTAFPEGVIGSDFLMAIECLLPSVF